MTVQLTPSWSLTTDHAASNYGQPVLVNKHTREAYGPGDVVSPYPSWGMMQAGEAVRRMGRHKPDLTHKEREFVAAFGGPPQ